jgi:hypothetical protein
MRVYLGTWFGQGEVSVCMVCPRKHACHCVHVTLCVCVCVLTCSSHCQHRVNTSHQHS